MNQIDGNDDKDWEMDGLCCQGNVEDCNATEFECRCGAHACEIHGHIEDEWDCPNESGPVVCRDDFVCDVTLAVRWPDRKVHA